MVVARAASVLDVEELGSIVVVVAVRTVVGGAAIVVIEVVTEGAIVDVVGAAVGGATVVGATVVDATVGIAATCVVGDEAPVTSSVGAGAADPAGPIHATTSAVL